MAGKGKKEIVEPKFARTKEYRNVLGIFKKAGNCPFCKDAFKTLKKPVLKKEKGWFVTTNTWPYKNTKYHFLIISEKHNENIADFKKSDFESVFKLIKWLVKKYKIKGGGVALRFGETAYSGSTVRHSHFHLISPRAKRGTKDSKTVIFSIG